MQDLTPSGTEEARRHRVSFHAHKGKGPSLGGVGGDGLEM
jgi:hypothetical protein